VTKAVKIEEIITAIEGMSVMDLANLVKMLEEKFGVSAAAPVAVAAPTAAGAPAEAAAPVEVDVILVSAGEKKIQVLKAVIEITGLGLKEAKELVDAGGKPVKTKIKKEEAEAIKAKLEAEGAKVEIK